MGVERVHQREEDGLFIGEVKVEAALGAIRGADNVIHPRAVVAFLGEDLFGGVEETLARRLFVTSLGMPLPRALCRSHSPC